MFAAVYCPDFYVQCEQLFAPELIGRAIVIIDEEGSNTSKLISSSPQARELGLEPGLADDDLNRTLTTLKPHQNIKICRPNYDLYADISRRLTKSLKLLAPHVSAYTNDQLLLDLDGLKLGNAEHDDGYRAYGKQIQLSLKLWLGISVAVGLAPTRILAELASNVADRFKEHHGILDMFDTTTSQNVLDQIPTSEIPGISQRVTSKLSEIGIHSALEFSTASKIQIKRHCSVVVERIALELSGIQCKDPSLGKELPQPPLIKEALTTTLPLTKLKRELNEQVVTSAKQLNSLTSTCSLVTLGLSTMPITDDGQYLRNTLSANLPKPCNSPAAIQKLANQLLESLWRDDQQYHSLTLCLEKLENAAGEQFGLFTNEATQPHTPTGRTIPDSIRFDILIHAKRRYSYGNRNKLVSPSFTTSWSDLLRVY